ncbi:MAG: hypothetical protein FD149_2592 [Rhodospirillaceae bacterium]|nr:MAG: hypothetical protein FD149_2592 [Rhodospirillaceae bacterium]
MDERQPMDEQILFQLGRPIATNVSATSDDIINTKRALNQLGYYEQPSDGAWVDSAMFDGIRRFQRDHGLKVDGVINPGGPTEHALNRALIHVRAYTRVRFVKVEHVSAHERSAPVRSGENPQHAAGHKPFGGGGRPFPPTPAPRAWEGKSNEPFRQEIAEAEGSANKKNNGYEEHHDGSGALGRYQLTPLALRDAGWKDAKGAWTDKAKEHGVTSDEGFKKNPEAQEAAMRDYMRRNEVQMKINGVAAQVGTTLNGTDGKAVHLTEAGLAAAAHRHGPGAVKKYLERRAKGEISQDLDVRKRDAQIQKRLRDFENAPYSRTW